MELIICIVITNIYNITVIKNTWLKLCNNIKIYFAVNKQACLNNFEDNYIFLDDNDIHFTIIRNFSKIEYDFIYITYENSYTNIENLLKKLESLNSNENIYLGGHGDYRIINNIKFYFHSYIPGIILNKSATLLLEDSNIMEQYNDISNNEFKNNSGVAIGYFSYIKNIKLLIDDNFHFCNWKGIPCHPNNIDLVNLISCSNMNSTDMYSFYNLLYKNNNIFSFDNKKMNIIICPGGGLGNLLFQYIYSFVLQKKFECNVYFQINYNYWRGDINSFAIFKHLNFIDLNIVNTDNFKNYNEKMFAYYDIDLKKNNNYKITGYYQSYKYSELYIEEIKDILFNNISLKFLKIKNKYNSLLKDKKTCLLHVRRGDYLIFRNIHPLCKNDYYINAIEYMGDCHYLICSDDNNFLNNWKVIENIDYNIIDLNDPEELFIFMSLCDNFIIANSSLSLLSYLFREKKDAKLIAPKIWFGSSGPKYKIEDLIPPKGILI
jgi:hypothetical protein